MRPNLPVSGSLSWYVVAILAVPLVTMAIAAGILGRPHAFRGTSMAASVLGGFVWQLVLLFVLTNWWEEVGWMGFVQARLQGSRGPVMAALITGPLFALQHISLVVGNSLLGAVAVMSFLVVVAIPFRFLTGWVYNCTGSVAVVGILHASGDAVTVGSGFGTGLLMRLYTSQAVGVMHILGNAVLGLVVLAATRGRLGAGPTEAVTGRSGSPTDQATA